MEKINLFIHIQNADKEQNINGKLFRFEERSCEQSWKPFGFSHINNQQPAPI